MSHNHIATARRVLDVEARAVAALGERVSDTFEQACELLLACKGRVIVTGMGKSGHIGS
ncbi:MAG TPA: D-arabinose 5-phosphate isomerase, partial [Alcanivorax sp.]|nr:D-arabinose 5-phosphate isomerase [Alcanivorax sp.]HBM23102.1 D-arabinose 5-phosphate isomerase [Alcanivorax sp.]HBP74607.1 D-arabinose 5-phosphate isomerase [Alcanivorax sp.]HBS13549.1 D-arabinose 5-phosphate isomerase [Alcanivorax sp.]HCJ64060.1 D-arabinose 5-phosphate isomerase [Alcanivorax sp.]